MHPRLIINLPTKRHYRDASRLDDIRAGLQALRQEIQTQGIESVAIPALGAGLGGLPWGDVRQEIETALADLEGVLVLVFEPHEKKPATRLPWAGFIFLSYTGITLARQPLNPE